MALCPNCGGEIVRLSGALHTDGMEVPIRCLQGSWVERRAACAELAYTVTVLEVVPVPCLRDNYAYLVIDRASRATAIVDPSDYGPVAQVVREQNADVREIWLTHHHWDHVGGVEAAIGAYPILVLRASRYDVERGRVHPSAIPAAGSFEFASHHVRVLEVPGHTLGAIAFEVDGNLFTGDTVFVGGCGRVFEGTMTQMASAMRTLRALPDATRVWCGHEYAESNLRFAVTIEPENQAMQAALRRTIQRRASDLPTVPSTIADERNTNPFFRFDRNEAHEATGLDDERLFGALRRAKDAY